MCSIRREVTPLPIKMYFRYDSYMSAYCSSKHLLGIKVVFFPLLCLPTGALFVKFLFEAYAYPPILGHTRKYKHSILSQIAAGSDLVEYFW